MPVIRDSFSLLRLSSIGRDFIRSVCMTEPTLGHTMIAANKPDIIVFRPAERGISYWWPAQD